MSEDFDIELIINTLPFDVDIDWVELLNSFNINKNTIVYDINYITLPR